MNFACCMIQESKSEMERIEQERKVIQESLKQSADETSSQLALTMAKNTDLQTNKEVGQTSIGVKLLSRNTDTQTKKVVHVGKPQWSYDMVYCYYDNQKRNRSPLLGQIKLQ